MQKALAKFNGPAPKRGVTHNGGAHRDDALTTCILLALFPDIHIHRRDPVEEEFGMPTTWIYDTGRRIEPLLGNFDHHQMNPKGLATCAFTLVLEHLGLLDVARRAWSWLEFTEVLDAKGPNAASALCGTTWSQFRQSLSPIEAAVIAEFASDNDYYNGDGKPITSVMRMIGEVLVAQLMAFDDRQRLLAAAGHVVSVGPLQVVVVPDTAETRKAPAFGVDEWRREVAPNAAVSVTPDDRGPGLTLFRIDDHPEVDFSRIKAEPEVIFAAENGFIAKISATDWETVDRLICLSTKSLAPAALPELEKEVQ